MLFLVKTHYQTFLATYQPTGALCSVKRTLFSEVFQPIFLYIQVRPSKTAFYLIGSDPKNGFFSRPLSFPTSVLPVEMSAGHLPGSVSFKLPGTPFTHFYLSAQIPVTNCHVDLVTCEQHRTAERETFEIIEVEPWYAREHVLEQIQKLDKYVTEDTSIFDIYAHFCVNLGFPRLARHPRAIRFTEALYKFESLGENCEFGFFQRHCGIEPLGLLRFAGGLHTFRLADAIRTRFVKNKLDQELVCELHPHNPLEYLIHDHSLGMSYHTWRNHPMDPKEVSAEESIKINFLKDKLIEDFEDGEKIFVISARNEQNETGLNEVFDAIRNLGNGTLLTVVRADADHPPGSVIQIQGGHLRGFVGSFAELPYAPNTLEWIQICRNALCILDR